MILLPNLRIWTIINHARDISRRQLTDKVFPHRRLDWLFAKANRLSRRSFRIDARRIDLRQDFDTAVGVAISGKAPDAVASVKRSGPFKAGVIDNQRPKAGHLRSFGIDDAMRMWRQTDKESLRHEDLGLAGFVQE